MCGIFGVVAAGGRTPSLSDAQALRCRDTLAHRGPDGAGLVRDGAIVFTHRRLAVVDRSAAGEQPMRTDDRRFTLVYNGELYNDGELRRALAARGVRFRSTSDAETVLHAFAAWGLGALQRMRGMYALAVWDSAEKTLTLARDPLGVKPLYFARLAHEIAFASEPTALLAHPSISPRPNLSMVSAYLTTIRTVLGSATLFDGVCAVEPGQAVICRMDGDAPRLRFLDTWESDPVDGSLAGAPLDAAARVHDALEDSVRRHLHADVPVCALLSGGLDSTIIAALASEGAPSFRTYAAGADAGDESSDLASARRIASELGLRHAETVVTRESFLEAWPAMIDAMGVPLSTPNEVAIRAVARRLRADGQVVALSGEGADELFGGYEGPLLASLEDIEAARLRAPGARRSPASFELANASWIGADVKPAALKPEVCDAVEHDAPLDAFYESQYERCARSCDPLATSPADSLDARVRLLRRINLTGLLQRLDTATMLEGVEGRVPFADARIAALAEALPMALKFEAESEASGHDAPGHRGASRGSTAIASLPRTKRILRRAFAERIPSEALERPKASFPLPFHAWIASEGESLRASPFARAIFTSDMIAAVAEDPSAQWRFAWPMLNIARWGDRWWGS